MIYIIHSKSERGFWNNKLGWVHGAAQATKFGEVTATAEPKCYMILPKTAKDDAEWIVYKYSE
jgi:hypothetical protein